MVERKDFQGRPVHNHDILADAEPCPLTPGVCRHVGDCVQKSQLGCPWVGISPQPHALAPPSSSTAAFVAGHRCYYARMCGKGEGSLRTLEPESGTGPLQAPLKLST